jgi:hypothetical protein
MATITTHEILMFMAGIFFFLGVITAVIGIGILITRATGREIRSMALQTTRLAQKGLADSVAGLVGNASGLLDAINELVRTTAGVGVFLTLTGLVLMVLASWIVLQTR